MPHITVENLNKYIGPLNDAMAEFEINTPQRIIPFLAQLAHESGSFKYTKEIASGEAYEGRLDLGNTQPGDGVRYKGRGPIQMTGRRNYQVLSDYFKQDFVKSPELLEGPIWGCKSAGWYWDEKRKINLICDLPETWTHLWRGKTYSKFEWITVLINGGLNGLEDRKKHLQLAEIAFS